MFQFNLLVVSFELLLIFRKMKQNTKKNHFKKQIVSKRKYVENDYKRE